VKWDGRTIMSSNVHETEDQKIWPTA
jgi:hypothetical protein